ncbi:MULTISPECIES: glycerol-3-phosphate 1-O-acyltransferase PlsY [Prochlorococcus]|uniref:glycerol-3-phosphate 1-O-acyltransferase PlsY n=1 Tax=Prochlorococcus TaxID=1218 RepID=UPI0005338794|nr:MULTISPECIES: glycerol-3-phosphate 1-O-acyltransferase PlsY [Prochlorococcus]KGG11949.1 Acyl-phosphate:glycerol-3-phosphate O-acyltransferase PlsY [Prochlorococcus sp. MIT 0601]
MEPSELFFGLICLGVSYFLGSIPTGFIFSKYLKGIDIRDVGSGSTGATNVLRHVGKKAALTVFLIDVGKGILSVLMAKLLTLSPTWQVFAGLASLSGHIWPIWLRWQGGKAVATGLGVFLGLSWQVGFASLCVFLAIFSSTKIVSISSLSAASSLPIFMLFILRGDEGSLAYVLASFAAMLLVFWRHRTNISRLMKGEETKVK